MPRQTMDCRHAISLTKKTYRTPPPAPSRSAREGRRITSAGLQIGYLLRGMPRLVSAFRVYPVGSTSDNVPGMDLDQSIAFWRSDLTDDQITETVNDWRIALEHPDDPASEAVQGHIVTMTFLAPPDVQWRFILIAAKILDNPDQVSAFAAGPLEGFLGRFADDWIDRLETECQDNFRLRHALKSVWRHKMTDAMYNRVQSIANTSPDDKNKDR